MKVKGTWYRARICTECEAVMQYWALGPSSYGSYPWDPTWSRWHQKNDLCQGCGNDEYYTGVAVWETSWPWPFSAFWGKFTSRRAIEMNAQFESIRDVSK